jgi:hypothetical protein
MFEDKKIDGKREAKKNCFEVLLFAFLLMCVLPTFFGYPFNIRCYAERPVKQMNTSY